MTHSGHRSHCCVCIKLIQNKNPRRGYKLGRAPQNAKLRWFLVWFLLAKNKTKATLPGAENQQEYVINENKNNTSAERGKKEKKNKRKTQVAKETYRRPTGPLLKGLRAVFPRVPFFYAPHDSSGLGRLNSEAPASRRVYSWNEAFIEKMEEKERKSSVGRGGIYTSWTGSFGCALC